jgi:hypothetical protein
VLERPQRGHRGGLGDEHHGEPPDAEALDVAPRGQGVEHGGRHEVQRHACERQPEDPAPPARLLRREVLALRDLALGVGVCLYRALEPIPDGLALRHRAHRIPRASAAAGRS